MADAVATYRVELEDGVSGTSKNAVNALQELKDTIAADQKELRALESAFKDLNKAQVVNIDAARALQKQITAKKEAIGQAQAAFVNLGGTFGKVASQGKAPLGLIARLREAAQAAPGPLAGLMTRLGGLSGLLKAGGIALGILAIAAATVVMVTATTRALTSLAAYGVVQADARRSELLRLEGLTKLRFWYAAAAQSAESLQDATDKVSANVAIGRDQVAKYTDQLYRAGLRGQNLEDALEAVSIKASVQGEAAASAFAGWAAGTALAGGSVRKLADDVKARLGPIAARQMLGWDVQTKKLRESFSALFNGLKLEPLLRGLRQVTELFGQSSESGKALKHLVGFLFQPLIDGSETAGLYVRRFFQGMIIAALKTENVILRLRVWFADTFGGSLAGKLDLTRVAVWAGYLAFGALAGAVGLTVTVLGALVAALALIPAAMLGAVSIGYHLTQMFVELWPIAVDIARDAVTWGKDIVLGIVKGLKGGAGWLADTMKDLGKNSLASFKKTLGISSPSKEFAKLGLTLPEGVAVGVERGAPQAQAAVDTMVSVPAAPASGPGQAGAGGARSAGPSIALSIGEVHVHTQATETKGIMADLETELAKLLERLALQVGARPVGA